MKHLIHYTTSQTKIVDQTYFAQLPVCEYNHVIRNLPIKFYKATDDVKEIPCVLETSYDEEGYSPWQNFNERFCIAGLRLIGGMDNDLFQSLDSYLRNNDFREIGEEI